MGQSVTLGRNAANNARFMHIAGVANAGFASSGTYVVPNGKRLVIKGRFQTGYLNGTTISLIPTTTAGDIETTVVGAGLTVSVASGSSALVATGFLEDDI